MEPTEKQKISGRGVRDMTRGNPYSHMVGFALPVLLSQIFQQLYRLNGALYYCKVDAFNKQNSIYDQDAFAYFMDKVHSVDVDDLADFQHAEALVQYLPEFKDYFR